MRLYAVHKGTYFCVAHVKKNVFRTPPWLTRINVTQISRNLHASQVRPALSGRMASIGSDPSIGSASRAGIEDTPSVSLLSESLMTRSAPQPLKSPAATDHSACPCCFLQVSGQEAQLMLTTGSTRLAVSRGQQTWYHSTCYI